MYDGLLIGMFAVFGDAWAVFIRKHLLGPLLKLGVVGLLIYSGSGVEVLAAGYVGAGLIAVLLYSVVLGGSSSVEASSTTCGRAGWSCPPARSSGSPCRC